APSAPHWTPDGNALLYQVSEQQRLYKLDLTSGETSVVLENFSADSVYGGEDISLSPDGTKLLAETRPKHLAIVDLADGSEHPVAPDLFSWTQAGTWSPDGRWLVFQGMIPGVDDGGIWAWNLDEQREQEV